MQGSNIIYLKSNIYHLQSLYYLMENSIKKYFKTAFLILSVVLSPLFLSSCDDNTEEDEREDRVKTVEKDGSVEVVFNSRKLDETRDIIETKKTFWVKNTKIKEKIELDTVPSLGKIKAEGTDSTGKPLTGEVKKEYEFYVTIK